MHTPLALRSLATLALAVGVATCADTPIAAVKAGPGPTKSVAAHVGLIPVFSQSATFAAQHLAEFGLQFDSVRIVLRGFPDTTVVVKDTTIFFSSSGPDSVSLDLTVPIQSVGQQFSAGMDYKGPNGVVFHGGPITVTSHAADRPAPPQDSIHINYVGPGHNVKAITIGPKSVTLSGVASAPFTVSAVDSNGAVTDVPPLSWTSSNSNLVSVSGSNAGGAAQSLGVRGSATITATSPTNVSDNASVSVVLPPASITVVSGAGQTGKVGSTLANAGVVQVSASDGLGVPGVSVVFAPPTGGSVGTTSATTDANGRAQTTLKLGGTVGPQSFAAVAAGFSVAIGATATAGDAAAIAIVSGNGQTGPANAPLTNPLVVKVTDAFGNGVSGTTVNWSRTGGSGALGAATSATDANGVTSDTYALGATAGSEAVSASIAGASVSFGFTTTAGAPAAIAIVSGNAQTGQVNQSLANPLVVKVTDVGGNAVANATVAWSAINGTIAATSTTDANGQTSSALTLGTTIGSASAVAKIANGQAVTFGETVTFGAVTQVAFTTQPSNATANVVMAPVPVVLKDAGGNVTTATNPVTIALGNNPSGATLTGTLTRNAVGGTATFDDLKLDKTGTAFTFVATSGSLTATSAPFNVGVGAAASLAIQAGNNQTATVGTTVATAPSVKVTDAAGNPVPGVVVTFAAASGSGTTAPANGQVTTDASGIATLTSWTLGTTAGSQSLSASATGLTSVTFHATAAAGAAGSITIVAGNGQSATVGTAVSAAPSVKITDASNNPLPGVVVTFAASGNGFVSPINGQATTNALGVATLTSWTLGTTAGSQSLTASATGAGSVTFNATAIAGAAGIITIAAGDGQNAIVGTAVLTAPSVKVTDASNNPLSGIVVTFTPASGSGSVSPVSGQVTTNASGIATLTSWTLGSTAGAQVVTATATGTGGATFHATAIAGAAGNITIVTGDNQTATIGTTVTAAPSVKVADASGNPVSGVVVTFAPAAGSGSVAPAGGQVTTSALGVATLTSWTLGTTAGSQSLTATAAGAGSVTFHATANPGAAASITIVTGDNQTATVGAAVTTAPSVKVADASGNPVPNVVVTFAPATGNGTVAPAGGQATTNALGVATLTSWTLGATAGSQSLTATAAGAGSVTFHAAANAGAPAIITIVAGDNQTGTVGTAVVTAPSVKVTDASSNPLPSVTVTFAVASGAGSLSPINGQATTNASGIATITSWTLGNVAGAQTLTASATGTGSVTIHATAIAGTANHLVVGGSLAFVADAQTGTTSFPGTLPSVTVQDAFNNPVTGASVFWSLGTPCATGFALGVSPTTTNTSGVATAPAITVPNGVAGSCPLLTSLTNSFGPTSNRFYTIMKPAGSTAWLGVSSDTAWATASNWSSGSAPTSATAVYVPAAVPAAKLLADGVAGSITLESGNTNVRLNTHVLTASGDVISSSGGINNGTLTLNGTGTVNIAGTLPTTNVGDAVSCGAFQLSGATTSGIITVNCPLTIGGNTLTTTTGGNFSTAGTQGRLVMANPAGLVDVNGTSTFAGASEATFLTDGTFEARGNFVQSSTVSAASYAPSGNHKTSLWGGSNQSVSFADPVNSFFNDVDVKSAGIIATFTTATTVNRDFSITSTSGTAQATFNQTINVARNLTANASTALVQSGAGKRIIVAGTVTAAPTADLGGVDSLRITGNTFPIYNNTTAGKAPQVTQLIGAVVLASNPTVAGDLAIGGSLELAGHTLTVLGGVDVVGNLEFLAASSGGTLKAGEKFAIDGGTVTAQTGTLQLSGDFEENGTMQPSAAFVTKLTGTSAQSVSFTHPTTTGSFFTHLEVANTNAFGATFQTNGVVTAALTVDANAVLKTGAGAVLTAMDSVTSANAVDMSGVVELVDSSATFPSFGGKSPATTTLAHAITMLNEATLTGNLIVQNTLNINTHKLTLGSDFTVGTGGLLKVATASDSIVVGGNATFAGSSQVDFPFTAGAFDFKGNLTVSGTQAFFVGGVSVNTTRFTGSSAQTISVSGSGNTFANVAIGRPSQAGTNVEFTSNATLTGLLDLNTSAIATVDALQTLTLSTKNPALNFHAGSIMHVNGTVGPSTLVCQRDSSAALDGSGVFGLVSTILPGSGISTTIDATCTTTPLP